MRHRSPTFLAIPVAAALLLAAVPALAADPMDQAKIQFNAGAQAYSAGKYAEAITAFEEAYNLVPPGNAKVRTPILFSLAQAERKQYYATNRAAEPLRRAVQHYQQYLAEKGTRTADATDALQELMPAYDKLQDKGPVAPVTASTTPEASKKARITIYVAVESGAKVAIDRGPLQDAPFIGELEPGRHHVRVVADGYFDVDQDILGEAGQRTTLEVPMQERPGQVSIETVRSGEVFIDGRYVANTPLGRPLDVPAGLHVVSVASNGAKLFSHEVMVERGKPTTVRAVFERSGQRTASWVLLGTGATALLFSGVATLVSLRQEGKAKDLLDAQSRRNLTQDELARYGSAANARDAWRNAAIVTASVGTGIALAGAGFYVFDKPGVQFVAPRGPRTTEPPPKPKRFDVELGAAMVPGGWGAQVQGTF